MLANRLRLNTDDARRIARYLTRYTFDVGVGRMDLAAHAVFASEEVERLLGSGYGGTTPKDAQHIACAAMFALLRRATLGMPEESDAMVRMAIDVTSCVDADGDVCYLRSIVGWICDTHPPETVSSLDRAESVERYVVRFNDLAKRIRSDGSSTIQLPTS